MRREKINLVAELGYCLKTEVFLCCQITDILSENKNKNSALLSKNRPNVRPRRLQINKSWISRKWLDKNNKYRALLIINTAWSIELLLHICILLFPWQIKIQPHTKSQQTQPDQKICLCQQNFKILKHSYFALREIFKTFKRFPMYLNEMNIIQWFDTYFWFSNSSSSTCLLIW